jgi:16S rRNA (guanine527-N7)-methyltransferase
MNKEQFIIEVSKLNIKLTDTMLEQLDKYYEILVSENSKYNLTAITDKAAVYLKHFYDSLTLSKIIELDNQSLCDIGTGAGFPGMVLKIVFPNLKVTLVDATLKKCKFLEMVIPGDILQVIRFFEGFGITREELSQIALKNR